MTFIGLSLVFIWGGFSFFRAGYFGAQGAAIGGAIVALGDVKLGDIIEIFVEVEVKQKL